MSIRTQTLFIIACTFLILLHLYLTAAAWLELSTVEIVLREWEKFRKPYELFTLAGLISCCEDVVNHFFKSKQ